MRTQTLTVAMNGDEVGTLYRDGNGEMSFIIDGLNQKAIILAVYASFCTLKQALNI